MKKLFLILSILLFGSINSYAAVDSQFMTTENFLVNTGYSYDMAKYTNLHVKRDPYSEVQKEENSAKNLTKRLFWYIFPGEFMDLDIYSHKGDFDNPGFRDF